MQALILAAGMGKRLGKYTENNTKCMVSVAGKRLIDRTIDSIIKADIKKIVIVIGYKGENLRKYIDDNYSDSGLEFIFVENKDYDKTNNIYSFYLARSHLVKEDTILIESDLIFEDSLIKKIKECPDENIAAVAKYRDWMDGTAVTCDENSFVTQFIEKKDLHINYLDGCYKTVNIYKFSKKFLEETYLIFLKAYIDAYGNDSYYEVPLKIIAELSKTSLKAFDIEKSPWYEIDDAQDLDIANVLFSEGSEKYKLIMSKFGGYWRYESINDFCYLVNPYFPPKKFIEKMKREFQTLLGNYPSGLNIQNMNAGRMFGIDEKYILTGNGASELINVLGWIAKGKFAVGVPTFNEYIRCFRNCEMIYIDNLKTDFVFDINKYKEICKNVDYLGIVNPDNPSGAMMTFDEIISIVEECKKYGTKIIVDESFIDFAYPEDKYTLLQDEILEKYDNLIIIKSIGKSYGVAGLRLGILASSDEKLLSEIRNMMQVWNINSFAEYYLQSHNLFAKDYSSACRKIAVERRMVIDEINAMDGVKAYPSQANYVMIDLGEISAFDTCIKALNTYGLLLKDLSTKDFFEGRNFIRVAVKSKEENREFLDMFKKIIKK